MRILVWVLDLHRRVMGLLSEGRYEGRWLWMRMGGVVLAVVHRRWRHALRSCRSILVWIIPEKTVSNPRTDFRPSHPQTFSQRIRIDAEAGQTRAPGRRRVRRRGELLGLAGVGDGGAAAAVAQQTKQEIEPEKGRQPSVSFVAQSSLTSRFRFPSTPPRFQIQILVSPGSYPRRRHRRSTESEHVSQAKAGFSSSRLEPPAPIEQYKRSRL